MIRVLLTFFSVTLGFFVSFVAKMMNDLHLAMRLYLTRQLWLSLLLGKLSPVFQRGRELASQGAVFFFRGSRLIQNQA